MQGTEEVPLIVKLKVVGHIIMVPGQLIGFKWVQAIIKLHGTLVYLLLQLKLNLLG